MADPTIAECSQGLKVKTAIVPPDDLLGMSPKMELLTGKQIQF